MKKAIFAGLLISSLGNLALAQVSTSGTRGGGSGCMGAMMRSAFQASQWLKIHGSQLKPSVSGYDFLLAANPDLVLETDENLQYQGNPVDAYYDGIHIKVRCDRFMRNNEQDRAQVFSHEVFRKMGLEGDQYEISRQIFSAGNYRPKAVSTQPGQANEAGTVICGVVVPTHNMGVLPLKNTIWTLQDAINVVRADMVPKSVRQCQSGGNLGFSSNYWLVGRSNFNGAWLAVMIEN